VILLAGEEKESGGKGREFRKDLAFLVFMACLLIGIGIGITYDQVTAGVLIGLGCGFLGSFIVRWKGAKS
jgi:hypothetical protein